MNTLTLGIDLAKDVFSLHGVSQHVAKSPVALFNLCLELDDNLADHAVGCCST